MNTFATTKRPRPSSFWDRAIEALRLDWEQTKRDLHLGHREVIKISGRPSRAAGHDRLVSSR
jgi:hypothetical protein